MRIKKLIKEFKIIFAVLIRPFVSAIAASISVTSYLSLSLIPNYFTAIELFFCVFLTSAYGFSLNDYFDSEKDKLSHFFRVIPANILTKKQVLLTSILLFFISITISLDLSFEAFAINLFTLIALTFYSSINNKYGIWANFITAVLCSFTFLIGMAESGNYHLSIIILALSCLLFVFGREIILDLRDIRADKIFGKSSFPLKYGSKKSVNLCLLLLIFTSILIFASCFLMYSTIYSVFIAGLVNTVIWVSFLKFYFRQNLTNLNFFLKYTRVAFILISLGLIFK